MTNVLLLRLSAMALLLNLVCWGRAVVASEDAVVRRARTAVGEFKTKLQFGFGGYATAKAETEKDLIKGMAVAIGGWNSSLYLSQGEYFDGSAADAKCLHVYIDRGEPQMPDRAIAVLLLGACGHNASSSVPRLLSFLEADDRDLRLASAMALGDIGDSKAVNPLLSRLSDDDALLRMTAINSLGKIGASGTVDALGKRLDVEPVGGNREAVVVALGRIGGDQALHLLISALNNEDYRVRDRAVKELARTTDVRVLEPLLGVVGRANWDALRKALVRLGKSEVPTLLRAFESHPDQKTRHMVAQALGDIKDPRAIDTMVATIVASSDTGKIFSAKDCLLLIGNPALEPLMKALDNKDDEARIRVIAALSEFRSPRTVGTLLSALDDRNPDVRRIALQILRDIGDARCVPPAMRMFKEDVDENVRHKAGEILGKFRPAGSLELLQEALSDKHYFDRLTAAWAVGEFGTEAESAIPALEKLLKDEWPSIREAAARSLKKIKEQKPGNDAD